MISRVSDHIQANGPMTFDDFMEMCLYDPDHGFFSAGAIRPGQTGDFVTSPEVSSSFGTLLGRWVVDSLPERDPAGWAVVEIGAGSGSLIRHISELVPESVPRFAVERSEAARSMIDETIADVAAVEDLTSINASHVAVVLNEVLDNVPAAVVRRTADGWTEVTVDVANDRLVLVEASPRSEVAAWADEHLGAIPVGGLATVQMRAGDLIDTILSRHDGVAVCVIDYGGTTADLSERSSKDIVRTYRHQRTGYDYLRHPFETDITVDVNTDALTAVARRHGADVRSLSQRELLIELGAHDIIDTLRSEELRLATAGDVMGQLQARSEAVGVRALLDRAGFGSFRVVIVTREPRTEAPAS